MEYIGKATTTVIASELTVCAENRDAYNRGNSTKGNTATMSRPTANGNRHNNDNTTSKKPIKSHNRAYDLGK